MPRRRREGFDYFVDKYNYNYDDGYYDDEEDYLPIDRFQKRNRYTGDVAGRPQFINTSTIYTPQQQRGTLEFSAIPGMGGLNPNQRPLGDQTMMFSNNLPEFSNSNVSSPNPYVQQIIETQQIQLDNQKHDLEAKINSINESMNAIAEKIEDVTKVISETQLISAAAAEKKESQQIPAKTNVIQPQPQQIVSPTASLAHPPHQHPTPTVAKPAQATKPAKKKKISTGVLVGSIFGILIAIGLIVVGVLMIMGVINF